MSAAKDMPAYLWWDQHGGSVPELQTFARLILAQPASASICERINSEFEFVKDRRRSRLGHEKANKLVALFHNLRLIKRMKEAKYSEPTIAWSAVEDHSGVAKYRVGGSVGTSALLNQPASSIDSRSCMVCSVVCWGKFCTPRCFPTKRFNPFNKLCK